MKILISIVTCILMFFILEAFVRLRGWEPLPQTYEGKRYADLPPYGRMECINPKVTRPYFNQPDNKHMGCVYYSINNLKLRNNHPVYLQKAANTSRIAVVGDSFSYGFGVLEEDTFEMKLEQMWKKENKMVEILNAAEPGAGLPEYEKILHEKVAPLNPDLIIIGINLNDIMTFNTSMILENVSRYFAWDIRQYSHLINFFCDTLERRWSSKENIKSISTSFTPERLNQFRRFIRGLKIFAEEKHSKFFVFIHPIFFDLDDYPFSDVHNKLDRVLKDEQVPFHDFLEEFRRKEASEFWITKNDQHPNEKAHQIYADTLFRNLKF